MLVTEVSATPDMVVMATARGLPTRRLTMADSAMPAMEVSATPGTEATAMARGLPTLRLTMVVSAMPVMEVSAMPVMEVLATPDMEDTHTASKMPQAKQGTATNGIA